MSEIPVQKCCSQEFYTHVNGMSVRHDIPRCNNFGGYCGWYCEESKCNRYEKPYKEGGAK